MTIKLGDKAGTQRLLRDLETSRRQNAESLEKLSSGQIFTSQNPKATERNLAEGLEVKLRGLASSKQNINDGISMVQTAEDGFSEIGNMLIRMKEINTAAVSGTLNDRERNFLFIEYQALHKEIDRIAATTEFGGMPLLNGKDERVPEGITLRIGDFIGEDSSVNELKMDGLKSIVATTIGLGLKAADKLLGDPISVDDALEFMEPEDSRYGTIYDQAMDKIAGFRATFGAVQSRLGRALDYNDVAHENIAAAKSRIADTDYAEEVSKMTASSIMMQTATALLTQSNLGGRLALGLVNGLLT